MTNFANGRDPLDELWTVILNRHWKYLDAEESLDKIEERKKLEGCFKEFLSVVPHDRKFYLTETGIVLKKTVQEMKDFTGFSGAIGFESISQYANNLFTKPWRKEYKTIKLYSGFFQHEIRNNLVDAEKLFGAMGYTMLPNQTLVLEGAICPDQVTNVSRDAMAAYVECEIMKQVNSELIAMGLATSWIEIFNYREFHIGDSSQTIKGLALHIQSRNARKVQENYGLSGPLPPLPHHVQQQQQQQQHQQQQQQPTMCNSHCSVHPFAAHNQTPYSYYNNQSFNQPCQMQIQQSNNYQQNYQTSAQPTPNSYYYEDQQNQHHLPHSKSLDQYDNSGNKVNGGVHQHRHSLDHSITNNYKMNQHIVPNPHQHHHQIQQQQQQLQQQQQQMPYDCVDSCGYNAYNNHPYNQPNNRFPLPFNLSSDLGALSAPPPPPPPTMRDPEQYYNGNPMTMQYFQHHPLMAHQIQIPTSVTDYHSNHQQKGYDMSDNSSPAMADNELINFETEPQRTRPMEVKLRSSLKKNVDSMNYSGAVKSSRKSPQHENYNDNYDDKEQMSSSNHRPTGAKNNNEIKNKDGIGNYHSWDYVYKNLEEQGCNKDQGERADEIAAQIQMQNLQLNNTGPPKLYPKSNGNAHRMQDTNNKPSISDNHQNSNNFVNNQKSPPSRRTKSTTSNGGGDITTKDNSYATTLPRNGNVNANNKSNASTLGRQKQSVNDKSTSKQSTVEWNCPHCTFINTDAKRICEMCSKSKDFYAEPDKPAKATATCV